MEDLPTSQKQSLQIVGEVGCNQCYLEDREAPDSCPVVPAVKKFYSNRGARGVYSDMAMRLLRRGTEAPIREVDVLDELFDDKNELSESTLSTRFKTALKGLKRVFGKEVVLVDESGDQPTYQVDSDIVQTWCQINPVARSHKEQTVSSVAQNEATMLKQKYKTITQLPGLTQIVGNYIMHDRQPDDPNENELFEILRSNITDAVKVTGNSRLVVDSVTKAQKTVLADGKPIRSYGKHPEAATRFHRLAYLIDAYRPQEDYIG